MTRPEGVKKSSNNTQRGRWEEEEEGGAGGCFVYGGWRPEGDVWGCFGCLGQTAGLGGTGRATGWRTTEARLPANLLICQSDNVPDTADADDADEMREITETPKTSLEGAKDQVTAPQDGRGRNKGTQPIKRAKNAYIWGIWAGPGRSGRQMHDGAVPGEIHGSIGGGHRNPPTRWPPPARS
ncbi:hypothetical protein N7462_005049 [Penicillium macrosclerotiorum]|uniref:uncharacterized protein n=1 Tax=Penicillium macrosclerotiorum TaxID=303699 RepID=UPI002549B70D|nr:uncharacterized protein N7462_005049 [Penicillium macrosclerotiorum]KAJ5690657.1 hypothetical protein N7462_005049 [Penicillium macrosclerotiorum]